MNKDILVGYEVGTGTPISIRPHHIAVTGQTQHSGKTTTLEGLVSRSDATALTFITKRGEQSFADARRVSPYFRDRADWQFVTSIIDATLQEKNKFLRPWIMKICRTTKTLAEVQTKVREALKTARGINEGVYTQLDAYLELIVPEIRRARLATTLDLQPGVNVMDVSGFDTPMQMLFIQSALDWVNANCRNTVVVIPEAWEFVPEGKGSPVKASAVALVRKGAGIGNFIWVDSQDMAGVDKVILRGCTTWLIGVQREANEIKRNIANIPAGIKRPSAADVATLERGQFFVCWGKHCVRTYVLPSWGDPVRAQRIAQGAPGAELKRPDFQRPPMEPTVSPQEADELRARNAALEDEVASLKRTIQSIPTQPGVHLKNHTAAPLHLEPAAVDRAGALPVTPGGEVDLAHIYQYVKQRAVGDPGVLRLLTTKPEMEVRVERKVVTVDESTTKGRIAKLIANGFFDNGATNSATRGELKRTGPDANNATIARMLSELVRDGFMTEESGARFVSVPGMKVNVVNA